MEFISVGEGDATIHKAILATYRFCLVKGEAKVIRAESFMMRAHFIHCIKITLYRWVVYLRLFLFNFFIYTLIKFPLIMCVSDSLQMS